MSPTGFSMVVVVVNFKSCRLRSEAQHRLLLTLSPVGFVREHFAGVTPALVQAGLADACIFSNSFFVIIGVRGRTHKRL